MLNIIVQIFFVKHSLFIFNWIILVTNGGWEYLRLLVSYDIQKTEKYHKQCALKSNLI